MRLTKREGFCDMEVCSLAFDLRKYHITFEAQVQRNFVKNKRKSGMEWDVGGCSVDRKWKMDLQFLKMGLQFLNCH